MTSVSVVVPAYNARPTIGDALNAVLRQSDPPSKLQVLVVDNGSTDGTPDVVGGFPGVTLLHEPKRGPSAARNCGLREATGEILVYVDADTLPTRTWLKNLIAPFVNPNVVLAAGRTLVFHPTTPVERYVAAVGLYETDRALNPPFRFAPSLNMAVRRSVAQGVGGWALELMTAEDVDFSQRVLKAYPSDIAYARDAVLFHRVRSTQQDLVKLALTYGQGAAQMYLRYGDEARWNTIKTARLRGWLALLGLITTILRAGHALRVTSTKRLEFSQCHLLFSRSFARGFINEYYAARRQAVASR